MAASNSYLARQNYRFLAVDQNYHHHHDSGGFELDESDIYYRHNHHHHTLPDSPELRKVGSRISHAKKSTAVKFGGTPSSLPVNIPDWSKILKQEYRENRRWDAFDDDEEDHEEEMGGGGGGARVPPHELIARTRMASFSVHEGVGRTLKGRDLSRVRNAIWEKTGFQD